jgi:hypothetical protein
MAVHPDSQKRRLARKAAKQDGTERKFVNNAVMFAIKCGALKRPAQCSLCGITGKVEAHHPHGWDSIQHLFLDIQWVCRSCHMQIHSKDWAEYAKRPSRKQVI